MRNEVENGPRSAVEAADDSLHVWLCAGCDSELHSARAAGRHAERTGHWLWRFPVNRYAATVASEEIHASDVGGYYRDPAPWPMTEADVRESRERRAA